MVNTHQKYPVDARHNTYYTASGSDLRDATEEGIEKYRLAAAHKRRKPESLCDKSKNTTLVTDVCESSTTCVHKGDKKGRGGDPSCDRDMDQRPGDKESKGEIERASSRES